MPPESELPRWVDRPEKGWRDLSWGQRTMLAVSVMGLSGLAILVLVGVLGMAWRIFKWAAALGC